MKQDKYEITISSSVGRDEAYASFVSYQSRQNALSFAPREGNRGQTYYFTLVLADPNQDRQYEVYDCRVQVTDGIATRVPNAIYSDIQFIVSKVKHVSDHLAAEIKFNKPVNLSFMEDTDAFLEMFDVKWYQNGDGSDKLQTW